MAVNDDDLNLDDEVPGEDDLDGPLPLRKAYRKLRRELPEREQEAERRGFDKGRTEARREILAETAARELGFASTFGETFLRANPDAEPSTETLRSFAEQLGVPIGNASTPTETSPPKEPVDEETRQAAERFNDQGAPSGNVQGKTYSSAEWLELFNNPATKAEAESAAKEGRVRVRSNVSGSGSWGRLAPH